MKRIALSALVLSLLLTTGCYRPFSGYIMGFKLIHVETAYGETRSSPIGIQLWTGGTTSPSWLDITSPESLARIVLLRTGNHEVGNVNRFSVFFEINPASISDLSEGLNTHYVAIKPGDALAWECQPGKVSITPWAWYGALGSDPARPVDINDQFSMDVAAGETYYISCVANFQNPNLTVIDASRGRKLLNSLDLYLAP